jgi:hypothetical protein
MRRSAVSRRTRVGQIGSRRIDLATREVAGWAMADHHRPELPVTALRTAAGRGHLEEGCIMHTDRGSEGGFN